MAEKQLEGVNPDAVADKIRAGKPITLKELAVHLGFGYSVVRSWISRGLPLLDGRIFLSDFTIWRRRLTGLEPDPRIVSRRRASSAGKSC